MDKAASLVAGLEVKGLLSRSQLKAGCTVRAPLGGGGCSGQGPAVEAGVHVLMGETSVF